MSIGWQGDLVRLVPLDHERHFANCYAWINDPEVTAWLLLDCPMSKLAEDEWFKRASLAQGSDVHFAIETLDGEHIGTSGIHGVNHASGYCSTGSLIGRKDMWGKGYGTDATRVRARFLFEVLGLRVIFSSVLEGNEASLRMQEKAGYEIYGRAPKKYWKRGQYRDEILTVLTRERWASLLD
jgi:RimJ/RimL family protein N-acetyltransferase